MGRANGVIILAMRDIPSWACQKASLPGHHRQIGIPTLFQAVPYGPGALFGNTDLPRAISRCSKSQNNRGLLELGPPIVSHSVWSIDGFMMVSRWSMFWGPTTGMNVARCGSCLGQWSNFPAHRAHKNFWPLTWRLTAAECARWKKSARWDCNTGSGLIRVHDG